MPLGISFSLGRGDTIQASSLRAHNDLLYTSSYNPILYYLFCSSNCSEVAQSCLTLCDPMDCSLPGSSLHGSLQVALSIGSSSSWLLHPCSTLQLYTAFYSVLFCFALSASLFSRTTVCSGLIVYICTLVPKYPRESCFSSKGLGSFYL